MPFRVSGFVFVLKCGPAQFPYQGTMEIRQDDAGHVPRDTSEVLPIPLPSHCHLLGEFVSLQAISVLSRSPPGLTGPQCDPEASPLAPCLTAPASLCSEVCMCVSVFVCVDTYRCLFPAVKKLELHLSDAIHFLKEGFSLPWNSPSRLA